MSGERLGDLSSEWVDARGIRRVGRVVSHRQRACEPPGLLDRSCVPRGDRGGRCGRNSRGIFVNGLRRHEPESHADRDQHDHDNEDGEHSLGAPACRSHAGQGDVRENRVVDDADCRKPREMSESGVPAIGVPSWLMVTVPALASPLACVIAAHVCPGATRLGPTARCASAGPTTTTTTTRTNSAFNDRIMGRSSEPLLLP